MLLTFPSGNRTETEIVFVSFTEMRQQMCHTVQEPVRFLNPVPPLNAFCRFFSQDILNKAVENQIIVQLELFNKGVFFNICVYCVLGVFFFCLLTSSVVHRKWTASFPRSRDVSVYHDVDFFKLFFLFHCSLSTCRGVFVFLSPSLLCMYWCARSSVCVFAFVCVCVYLCEHVCVCVFAHVWFAHVCVFACVCVCVCVHSHVCECVKLCFGYLFGEFADNFPLHVRVKSCFSRMCLVVFFFRN